MKNENSSDEPLPKSSWGRKLAIALAAVLVLLVVLYFVISSSGFLKGVVLPRVAKALKAEVTVADASLSPFSQLTLEKLKVQTTGAEPLLTAEQVRVRYSLFSILRGHYVVDELTLTSPTIQIVKGPSGTSNLDPFTQGAGGTASSSKSEGPLLVAIRNVSIKDGTVRSIERAKDGSSKTTELGRLNVSVDHVENGQSGKMTVASSVKLDNRVAPGQAGTNDLVEGKITGTFDFKLDQKLLPQTLTGNATLAFARAEGGYAQFSGLGAALQAELTPSEVRQFLFRFERAGQTLGQIRASGPLELAKSEGRLKLEVQSLDRQVLNLFGASRGWDFADSTVNATNYVDFAKQGEVLGAKGQLVGRQISIRQKGQATPAVDLDMDYDVSVNRNDQAAVIRKLVFVGRQQEKEFLRASLDRPMTLTWAANAKGFAESTFQLALTNLNVKEWQPLLGTNLPIGRLGMLLSVVAKEDGKQLGTSGSATVQDMTVQVWTNRLDQADLNLGFDGTLENFKTLDLKQFRIEVQQRQQPFVKANGSAHSDLSKSELTLQASAEIILPALLRNFPMPPLTATNGVVRLSSAVNQKGQKYSVTGNASFGDFTGTYGSYSFQDYQTALDYNIDFESPSLQIHSASLALRKGFTSGGSIALSGDYDLEKQSARLTYKMVDVNENALGPFLAPFLGDNQLVSISLSGEGSTAYDPKGETTLKAGLSITNWVVAAPQKQFVSPKLGAQVQLDGSLRQQVLDLRQCLLSLSPTARAKNELAVKAHMDLGKTNASPSQLTVTAESLDVTPYYDMFAGNKPAKATATPTPKPPSDQVPTVQPKPGEPAPMSLPFEQLTSEIKIDRLYLREIAITNLNTKAQIQHGELTVKPLELTLNGAPVHGSAVLNLGVPGYTYDVSFQADRVPIEPLSNSLTTNAPGVYKGDLITQAQLKGAGVTGPSLQKNLSGSFSLSLTNMRYEIVGTKTKRLLVPIAMALQVPELAQTPLNWVSAKAEIGKGQVDLQQFVVQSQAFYAESRGVIPIAEVLTNSPLNLPVTLSLRRALAEKAHLSSANAPTNTVYAALPTFVTLTGTLGDPKTEINKLVIGGLLARSIGGLVPMGGKAGTVLQGLGSALSGQPAASASTNATAATNASSAANLVQGLNSLLSQPKKDRAATNAPAPSPATNKPARPSALDLLKLIPDQK